MPFQSKKYNLTAYRILFLMKVLLNHGFLTLQEINETLIDRPEIGRLYTQETIKKYLNTLNLSGLMVKAKGRAENTYYVLEQSPMGYKGSEQCKNALSAILSQLQLRPLSQNYFELRDVILRLLPYSQLDEPVKKRLLNQLEQMLVLDEEVQRYQQYCRQGQVLNLTVGQLKELKVEPLCVEQHRNVLCLKVICLDSGQLLFVPLKQISSVEQLPSAVSRRPIQTQVVFKLTQRVAQNYRPRENETTAWQEETLIVTHRTDDVESLVTRLVRYGDACHIISPDSAQKALQTRIKNHLENLRLANTPSDELLVNLFVHQQETLSLAPA